MKETRRMDFENSQSANEIIDKVNVLIQKRDIDCPLCTQVYIDPRILSCNHVICFTCAEDLAARNCDGQATESSFKCPICQARQQLPLDGVSKLRKDVILAALVEASDILADGASVRCTSCDMNRALHACFTCGVMLCDSCHRNHNQGAENAEKHESCSLRNLAKPENFIGFQRCRFNKCKLHPNQKLALFCKYDEKIICKDCANDDQHKGHFRIQVIDKIEKDISEMKSKLSHLEEERREINKSTVVMKSKQRALELNTEELCRKIDHTVDEICRKVKEYGHRLKKDLNAKMEKKIACIEKKLNSYTAEMLAREKMLQESAILPALPAHSVLEAMDSIQYLSSHCHDLPEVNSQQMEKLFPDDGFVPGFMDDSFLVASFKSLVGFVTPVSRKDRQFKTPPSDMDKDLQKLAMESIHSALDSVSDKQRRPTTYTTIAHKICEQMSARRKDVYWQCIVGIPGQLGYNIACSKKYLLRTVVDGVEITIFAPKL